MQLCLLFSPPTIEHRNMPMQDAMMLVAHNYDTYKVENREKEREEIARKAAKMADDVLLREPDRESHPVSVLTTITLLSENRFLIQQLEMCLGASEKEEYTSFSFCLLTLQVRDSRRAGYSHSVSERQKGPSAAEYCRPPDR